MSEKLFLRVFFFDGVKQRETILVLPVIGNFINMQFKNNVEVF